MLILAAVAALSLSARAAPAFGGEEATTHRVGDRGSYRLACGDADSMIAFAERGGVAELWAVMVEQGKCSESPKRIKGALEAWIVGPFASENTGVAGSVWRVLNQYGDTVFIWISDEGGPHAARREMGL